MFHSFWPPEAIHFLPYAHELPSLLGLSSFRSVFSVESYAYADALLIRKTNLLRIFICVCNIIYMLQSKEGLLRVYKCRVLYELFNVENPWGSCDTKYPGCFEEISLKLQFHYRWQRSLLESRCFFAFKNTQRSPIIPKHGCSKLAIDKLDKRRQSLPIAELFYLDHYFDTKFSFRSTSRVTGMHCTEKKQALHPR